MATLRELKGRIGSVGSSEKITGAMKMISSAKMHKAEGELRRLQPYRDCIQSIIANLLSADATFTSPLTAERPMHRVTIVVMGSDDGLCGAYNVNLVKFLASHIDALNEKFEQNTQIDILCVGRKMLKAAKRLESTTVRVNAAEVNSKSTGKDVNDYAARLQADFIQGRTDRVEFVYMHYYSAGRQRPQADQMLPLTPEAFATGGATGRPYLFEPSAQAIYATALPMYLTSLVQEIFVENRASEQAARVMAMQSANDNAKKLQEQLSLEYNKLRQQSITTELLDIVGGQVRD